MKDKRMRTLINFFINYLTERNNNKKVVSILKYSIGMKEDEWKELGWNFHLDEEDDDLIEEYTEIEFFEGDEGDIRAEKYVKKEKLKDYEIEWDDYRKGYSLRIPKEV